MIGRWLRTIKFASETDKGCKQGGCHEQSDQKAAHKLWFSGILNVTNENARSGTRVVFVVKKIAVSSLHATKLFRSLKNLLGQITGQRRSVSVNRFGGVLFCCNPGFQQPCNR
jgi:hypothetical protein